MHVRRRALRDAASTAREHGGQRARRRLLLLHLPDLTLQLEHLLPEDLSSSSGIRDNNSPWTALDVVRVSM